MSHPRPLPQNRKLFDPKTNEMKPNDRTSVQQPLAVFTGPTHAQVDFLERLAADEISKAEMSLEELDEKEKFRLSLQQICRDAVVQYELEHDKNFNAASVSLKCFGSLSTGFATHSSDMDLALVSPHSQPDMSSPESMIPRLLEKALLDAGYGARLLTRTRVPIIKLCEKPTPKLRTALVKERLKWEEIKDNPPETPPEDPLNKSVAEPAVHSRTDEELVFLFELAMLEGWYNADERNVLKDFFRAVQERKPNTNDIALHNARAAVQPLTEILKKYRPPPDTHLDFPKDGIGIQCDINFSNPLALHNTRLLRCYSLCDPRVRLIVIFVKAWAKQRRINSPYHGTLSSYGYVLMVLHYLANIVEPAIIPNLQQCGKAFRDNSPENNTIIDGYNVRFWRSEAEIRDRASRRLLTKNHEDSIGIIICGFFHYFAHQNTYSPAGGFSWSHEVLSLRTRGGILPKREKGWTIAKSVVAEPTVPGRVPREIKHRYLLAIEDPFETDHNIARTVIHPGIVAIRDEFRRAVAIIQSVGSGMEGVEELFAEAREIRAPPRRAFGPLPRNGDAAVKSKYPAGTKDAGGTPGSSKDELASQTDQVTVDLNQMNINFGVTSDRRKPKHPRNRQGSGPLHNQSSTSGPSSSRQPIPKVPFSHSGGAPMAANSTQYQPHQHQNLHP
jgi:terminal uridylyltransferase